MKKRVRNRPVNRPPTPEHGVRNVSIANCVVHAGASQDVAIAVGKLADAVKAAADALTASASGTGISINGGRAGA
jgi:hypothetical protein